jgi:hypothetical protein
MSRRPSTPATSTLLESATSPGRGTRADAATTERPAFQFLPTSPCGPSLEPLASCMAGKPREMVRHSRQIRRLRRLFLFARGQDELAVTELCGDLDGASEGFDVGLEGGEAGAGEVAGLQRGVLAGRRGDGWRSLAGAVLSWSSPATVADLRNNLGRLFSVRHRFRAYAQRCALTAVAARWRRTTCFSCPIRSVPCSTSVPGCQRGWEVQSTQPMPSPFRSRS